jgi:hypothetical protein
MDIRCTICGEPWEIDSIHEEVEVRYPKPRPWMVPNNDLPDGVWELKHDQSIYEKYFDEVRRDFVRRGCVALGGSAEWCKPRQSANNREIAQAIYDIMGDDIDGAAAAFEDAEYMGYLD